MYLCRTLVGLAAIALACGSLTAAADPEIAGAWKVLSGGLPEFTETWTFTQEKETWKVTGVYVKDGQEVGSCHGEKVEFANGVLTFRRVFDKKPGPNFGDAKCTFRVVGGKGQLLTYVRTQPNRKVLEPAGKAAAAKTTPDPEPKTAKTPDPEPKVAKKPDPDPKTTTTPDPAPKAVAPYTEVATFRGTPRSTAYGVAISPDGKRLALGEPAGAAGRIVIAEFGTKKILRDIDVPGIVTQIAWSADGTTLAAVVQGDLGGTGRKTQVPVWDTATWEEKASFEHPNYPGGLTIAGNGSVVACASAASGGGVLKVWDVAAKKEVLERKVQCISSCNVLSADGKTLAVGALAPTGQLTLIDVPSGKVKQTVKGSETFAMSADTKTLVTIGGDGKGNHAVNVWQGGKIVRTVPLSKWEPTCFVLLNNDKHVAVGGTYDEVVVCEVATGKVVQTLKMAKGQTVRLGATADSSRLMTFGTDRVVRLWSTPFGPKE
jgi:hypothetical protein